MLQRQQSTMQPYAAVVFPDVNDAIPVTELDATSETETMHILIDQSSSMQSISSDAFAGAREVVGELPDDAVVTISTFATHVSLGNRCSRADALRYLDEHVAIGKTALYDAVAGAVQFELASDSTKSTIVVVTDGLDTCSQCSREHAHELVQTFQGREGRRVLFLGANQDAILSAAALGIPVARALTYGARSDNVRAAFRAVAENVHAYREGSADGFANVHRESSVAQQV